MLRVTGKPQRKCGIVWGIRFAYCPREYCFAVCAFRRTASERKRYVRFAFTNVCRESQYRRCGQVPAAIKRRSVRSVATVHCGRVTYMLDIIGYTLLWMLFFAVVAVIQEREERERRRNCKRE